MFKKENDSHDPLHYELFLKLTLKQRLVMVFRIREQNIFYIDSALHSPSWFKDYQLLNANDVVFKDNDEFVMYSIVASDIKYNIEVKDLTTGEYRFTAKQERIKGQRCKVFAYFFERPKNEHDFESLITGILKEKSLEQNISKFDIRFLDDFQE